MRRLSDKYSNDEHGLIAIFVALIITTILALTTIGFGRIMNREYRQAVDRDLSTQAFYAAQSGLSDASEYIAANSAGATTPQKNTCQTNQSISPYTDFRPNLSGDNQISYSCLLFDGNIFDLRFDNLQPNRPRVFKVTPSGLDRFLFSWQDNEGDQGFKAVEDYPKFYDQVNWNAIGGRTGALEVTIFPVYDNDSDRNALRGDQLSYIMYPTAGAATFNTASSITPGGQTAVVARAQCNNSYRTGFDAYFPGATTAYACNNIVFNDLSNDFRNVKIFYIRVTALYNPVNLMIRGASSVTPVALPGAQVQVDVTGKANDVLRRLQTRVTLTPNLAIPDYSIRTTSTLCKRIRIPVLINNTYASARVDDAEGAAAGDGAACLR